MVGSYDLASASLEVDSRLAEPLAIRSLISGLSLLGQRSRPGSAKARARVDDSGTTQELDVRRL